MSNNIVLKVYNCDSCGLYVIIKNECNDMNIHEVYRQHAEYCKGKIQQTIQSKENSS